jgi:alpha-L-rhamnosidase
MKPGIRLFLLGLFFSCAVPRTQPEIADPPFEISDLTSERRANPIGLDVANPHFAWRLVANNEDARDKSQSAYRILVASTSEKLARNDADLWDSGQVQADTSTEVPYTGKPLGSRQAAHWKVRVWDEHGKATNWSKPAQWEMGLLKATDWQAEWIGRKRLLRAQPLVDESKLDWLWYPLAPGELPRTKPKSTRWVHFRNRITITDPASYKQIYAILASTHETHVFVEGIHIDASRPRSDLHEVTLLPHLKAGENVIGISTRPETVSGLAVQIHLIHKDGRVETIASGPAWKSERDQADGWAAPDFDDRNWKPSVVLAPFGKAPFDKVLASSLVTAEREAPAYLFRRVCRTLPDGVVPVRARLYATALGVYDVFLNGRRVGDALLAPGWTDYHKRIEVQAHDVTAQAMAPRETNCTTVSATLADGWYTGFIGYRKQRGHYGDWPLRLRAQVEIEWSNGQRETIVTDGNWKAGSGPILNADLLDGETYDARKEIAGWPSPADTVAGFGAADVLTTPPTATLVAETGPPIRVVKEVAPVAVTEPRRGVFIFDVGQNLVGIPRLKVRGPAGTRVELRFAEMLNPDGTAYLTNLRTALATDAYILKGDSSGEIWAPRFTNHGFRYVEVKGFPGKPTESSLLIQVTHSDIRPLGSFKTSNAMVNQLQSNIQWGQRSNFVGLPTDCPQRDERLGWMGDAQIFARTACFNMDVRNFFQKWMRDVFDAQAEDGAVADTIPSLDGLGGRPGAPGWADAAIIIPWEMYRCSGDTRFLSEHFDSMRRHIDFIASQNPDRVWAKAGGNNYGDWLSINADTPKPLLGTAYFAHSTGILADIARVLQKTAEAKKYDQLRQEIVAAFNANFVMDDTLIKGDTQTGYLLALQFDLLPRDKRARAMEHLVAAIERANNHLSTGFLGVRELLPVLSQEGRLDLAYRLLLNDTFPSWGYSIKQGATTIWERWDGFTHEKGFGDDEMNSFNHYSLGSVGQWLYANVGGIESDPAAPGYKHFFMRPRPGGGLISGFASYDSPRGWITSDWRIENGTFFYKIKVPVNSRATVELPDGTRHEVGSGNREFQSKVP